MCPLAADNRVAIGRVAGVFEAVVGVLRAHKDDAGTAREACAAVFWVTKGNGGWGGSVGVARNGTCAWWVAVAVDACRRVCGMCAGCACVCTCVCACVGGEGM